MKPNFEIEIQIQWSELFVELVKITEPKNACYHHSERYC